MCGRVSPHEPFQHSPSFKQTSASGPMLARDDVQPLEGNAPLLAQERAEQALADIRLQFERWFDPRPGAVWRSAGLGAVQLETRGRGWFVSGRAAALAPQRGDGHSPCALV